MKIIVVGLGYVGLPLAVRLSEAYEVTGYDINTKRVSSLKIGKDYTGEIEYETLRQCKHLKFTSVFHEIKNFDTYIITVPTPVDKIKKPDLQPLENACDTVGKAMRKGSLVIIESTVYPGVTENICLPILVKSSGLKQHIDFSIAYSPERINPGDKVHSVDKITKVVAGDSLETTKKVSEIYKAVIGAGVYEASSIQVAEAAKAIENTQRDINIAFVNEVAMICKNLNISVHDVLEAAGSKWNFLPFKPGLVGGHCIGVDPYYLAHISQKMGHEPQMILAGRRINDSMPSYIANNIAKNLSKGSRILQLGLSFKENVSDIRNSKAAELAGILNSMGFLVEVEDPLVDKNEAAKEYDIEIITPKGKYDCIIGAVSHDVYTKMSSKKLTSMLIEGGILADIKGIWRKLAISPSFKRWVF